MTQTITRDFLKQHGSALIKQGYQVIPIQQGKKAPGFDGWQKSKATQEQLDQWLEGGFKSAGVGILTKYTCAIDIDCLDEDAAMWFDAWCKKNIGSAPTRIGRAPKRLLLYRTNQPFKKRRSSEWIDEWGHKQLIEALGDGQQFVAFHIHPDTGKPYFWIDDRSPLTVHATQLTEITIEQIEQLLDEFEVYAAARKWEKGKGRRGASQSASADDNPWLEDTSPIDISDDELRTRLMMVNAAHDYDTWYQVGMSLFHQYDGEMAGFDLWNEWSETADNYDHDALERHWQSFSVVGKKRAPLTARYILRLAKEHGQRTAIELSMKLRDAFIDAKDLEQWESARQLAKEAEIDNLARSALAQVAKDRRDAITNSKTSLAEIKKAIAYSPKRTEGTPSWCEGWVYDVAEDRFFHLERKIATSKQGFDAMYDRKSLTKKDMLDGKSKGSMPASDLALNIFQIPTVDGRRYMPGRDEIFHEPDGQFANTYPEHEIPALPEDLVPRDRANIERVKAHIAHLLTDEGEQRALLDWLSWVVQNPGSHMNYAVLLQGVEGDGKSFFAEMMRVVMGVSNVTMLNANSVVNSNFTDWAYGQCLACIEEVRIVGTKGRDKWETVNRIRPLITNHIIEIHPKGKAIFNVKNTTSYLMFTNWKDAVPIDDNSRRYLVLFSRWQRREDLKAFLAQKPNYYLNLYRTIEESGPALRKWLLEHQQDTSFNPMGNAPETRARTSMVRASKTEFIQVLDEVIAENEELSCSKDLIDITEAQDVLVGRGVDWPGPKAIRSFMEKDGYEAMGRVWMPEEKSFHYFFSKNSDPAMFASRDAAGDWKIDPQKVHAYIAARLAWLDDF